MYLEFVNKHGSLEIENNTSSMGQLNGKTKWLLLVSTYLSNETLLTHLYTW